MLLWGGSLMLMMMAESMPHSLSWVVFANAIAIGYGIH